MELFKFYCYGDACSIGVTGVPVNRFDVSGLVTSFGHCTVNHPPSLTYDTAVQRGRLCDYFHGFEKTASSWESRDLPPARRGTFLGPPVHLLKPTHGPAPLDLRMKKSFHIESLTSDLSPQVNIHLPSPRYQTSDFIVNNPAPLPPKKKDHSISSFLSSIDKQVDRPIFHAPLNLSTGIRDTTQSTPQVPQNGKNREDDEESLHHQADLVSVPVQILRSGFQLPQIVDSKTATCEPEEGNSGNTPSSSLCDPDMTANSDVIKCQHIGCHKTFHSKGAMTIHAHRFHSGGTREEIEPEVRTKRCHQHRQHKQRRPREKPTGKHLLCTYSGCGKSFREMKHLKVHQMQHTDDRPLACTLCPYKCRQRNSMNWHMKAKHGHDKKVTQDGKTIYLRRDEVTS